MLLSMSEVERVSLAGVQENIVQPSVEGTVSDPTILPNVVPFVSQIWVSYLDVTRFSVVAHITVRLLTARTAAYPCVLSVKNINHQNITVHVQII